MDCNSLKISRDPNAVAGWSSDLKEYERTRREAPGSITPVVRHTRQKGREWLHTEEKPKWNPILQVPQLTSQMDRMAAREVEASVGSVNRGVQKALDSSAAAYDPISFNPKYGLGEDEVEAGTKRHPQGRMKLSAPSCVGYDIVNLYGADETADKPTKPSRAKQRDFNIFSGEYVKDNEAKQAAKEAAVRDSLNVRFMTSHTYNPLLGKFCDGQVEAQARESEAREAEAKCSQLVGESGSRVEQRSDGHAFNILSNEPKRPEKMKAFETRDQKGMETRLKFRDHNARYVDSRTQESRRKEEQGVARFRTSRRMLDGLTHGHDVITNQSYGHTWSAPAKSEPHPRPTAINQSALKVPTVGEAISKQRSSQTHRLEEARATAAAIARAKPSTTFDHVLGRT